MQDIAMRSGMSRLFQLNFTNFKTTSERELASLFSEENRVFLSSDHNARVSLGIPVPKKQTTIPIHLEYRVKISDHDLPIGEKHKLIPSVYAACEKKRRFYWLQRADIHSYLKLKKWQKFCCFRHWRLSDTSISWCIQGSALETWRPETHYVRICSQWTGQGSKKYNDFRGMGRNLPWIRFGYCSYLHICTWEELIIFFGNRAICIHHILIFFELMKPPKLVVMALRRYEKQFSHNNIYFFHIWLRIFRSVNVHWNFLHYFFPVF